MSDAYFEGTKTQRIRYWAPLEAAWERMKELLFRPFELGFWLVLGFSAWLAGLGSGPGGGASNIGDHSGNVGESLRDGVSTLVHSTLLIALFLCIGLAVLLLIIILFWVSSRGKFIFLDNVIHQRAEIVEPWGRLRRLGDSLCLWRIGFLVAVLVLAATLIGIPMVAAAIAGGGTFRALSVVSLSAVSLLIILSVVVLAVGAALVSLFLDSFIVPIMYRFDLKATEAWRHFLPWIKARPGSLILYGAFVLMLFLGFGIVSVLACFMTCCISAIPYIGTVIFLPLFVTFRYFSLEWLAQFDEGFDFFSPLPGEEEEALPSELPSEV